MLQAHQNNQDVVLMRIVESKWWLNIAMNMFKILFLLISQIKGWKQDNIFYGNIWLNAVKNALYKEHFSPQTLEDPWKK